jgi:hypothetical protein
MIMLGIEVNLQTGSVRLNLGYTSLPLTPNFSSSGFTKVKPLNPSLLQITQEKLELVSVDLWREFPIADYLRVRPLLLIPYLSMLGDIAPVVILDHEPVLFHTREPKAMGFTDFKGKLSHTNLLPVVVSSKTLQKANLTLRQLAKLPRERPLIMVLDDEDTLPIHGKYLRVMVRPQEMTALHELSLLKFWALTFYETVNFGSMIELGEVVRLESKHFEGTDAEEEDMKPSKKLLIKALRGDYGTN